jgi:hypothetical protein
MDEDDHQRDRVGREVLQLEPIILQQREEEGGQRRHQLDQGIRRKLDDVSRPHVGQRRNPMLQLKCETRCLPPHQPLQAGKGARRLEPRRWELSDHGGGRRSGAVKKPRGA